MYPRYDEAVPVHPEWEGLDPAPEPLPEETDHHKVSTFGYEWDIEVFPGYYRGIYTARCKELGGVMNYMASREEALATITGAMRGKIIAQVRLGRVKSRMHEEWGIPWEKCKRLEAFVMPIVEKMPPVQYPDLDEEIDFDPDPNVVDDEYPGRVAAAAHGEVSLLPSNEATRKPNQKHDSQPERAPIESRES